MPQIKCFWCGTPLAVSEYEYVPRDHPDAGARICLDCLNKYDLKFAQIYPCPKCGYDMHFNGRVWTCEACGWVLSDEFIRKAILPLVEGGEE